MKKMRKALAVLMAGAMLVGCGSGTTTPQNTESTPSGSTEATTNDTPLVIACDDMSEKFSEFFAASVPDQNVADMTAVGLLSNDRAGEIIYNGIEGETKTYNGTDYTYYGLCDCVITENEDGTAFYDFKLREGVKFSDGEELTADDVIFSYYVYLDPSYDGSASLYALPIEGLAEYRGGSEILYSLLLKNGAENTDFTHYTEDVQKKFFETDFPAACEAFGQAIVDYCVAGGYITDATDVAGAAALWGYADFTGTTAAEFTHHMAATNYNGDYAAMSATEKASEELFNYLPDEYKTTVETGESVDYVSGIQKTGDYSVRVVLTEIDATAIYNLAIMVQPLHYYGDESAFDVDAHKFGFTKGDLSSVRAKTTAPMGAGPYKFVKYENKIVYMEANENYYLGAPKIKNIQFKTTSEADKVPGVVQGTVDVSEPSISKEALEQIKGENSNGEASGDVLSVYLRDYNGYGYIGINSKNVKVGDDAGSEASKNFRKALGTILSVYRDVAIDSYYGEAASVINYPISNTSWAAPQKSDADYKVAFSTDVNGNPIYTEGMSQEEKNAAALQAALGFFEAAGFTVTDGKLTAAPEGAALEYELMIGGGGSGDHPSFAIVTEASAALKSIGFTLTINDLTDTSVLWNGLEAGTVAMWCAAWSATLDPDMFQIYHSEGGSAGHYAIYQKELDDMVIAGRTNTDQTYRKAVYKEALDYVVDYAVEVPIYQRQECSLFSSARVNIDTVCPDQTPFYGWMAEIHKLEMK